MMASVRTRIAIVGDAKVESRYCSIVDRFPDVSITGSATSVDELLDRHDAGFDAVVVAADFDGAVRLAEAGKHALLTGNPSNSIPAAIAAFENSSAMLMIGNPLRFRADIAAIKQSLDSGELGDPGLLRVHCWQRSSESAESQMLGEIDLAIWLFGIRPTAIYSVGCSIGGRSDYAQIHLGFPNEGMAMIDVNAAMPNGDTYRAMSLIGSNGAAYADDHHNMQLVYQGKHPSAVTTSSDRGALLAQFGEFVESIQANRQPGIDSESWQAIMMVADAASQSKASGRAIQWTGGQYEVV